MAHPLIRLSGCAAMRDSVLYQQSNVRFYQSIAQYLLFLILHYTACMLTEYVSAAMRKAHYELLPDDKLYYGEIPGFQGIYATADTLEDCREELQQVLEDWLLLSIYKNLPIPVINNISLEIKHVA